MDDPIEGGQIRSIIERVQRLQEEKRTIEDDIKEVYAEARANGYDVKVLRAVVKHLGKDQAEVSEFEAIFDLYLQAFEQGASRAHVARDAGARTREAVANAYPERVSRPVKEQGPSEGEVGSAVRADAPADQPAHFPPERDPQSGHHGSDSEGVAGGESPHLMSGSEQGSAEAPQARNEPGSDGAASGGGGVKASPKTPAFTLPPAKPLRPHCLKPDACGGSGAKHCFTCTQALNEARQPELEEA